MQDYCWSKFFDKQPEFDTCYERCRVTLHVNMTPLTVDDRLPRKTSQTEIGWVVEKMIVEFPARQWNSICLFDLLRIIESTGFAKRLNGSDWRHSEWTDYNIKSINNLNWSQDGQPGHSFLCFLLILWLSLFCELLFRHTTASKVSKVMILLK